MKLATFWVRDERRVGVVDTEARIVRELTSRLPPGAGMIELIEDWAELSRGLADQLTELAAWPLDEVRLCAPIPLPKRNIICVGKNYVDHATEFSRSGFDQSQSGSADVAPAKPIFFTKMPSAVVGPDAQIELHQGLTEQVDYEAELAVVIGTGGRGIKAAAAYQHVWGYTALNDVTARDLQRDHRQWLLGKSLDTHCPMGPWIVTFDDVVPEEVVVECRVNGELRQSAKLTDLIFDIPNLIETISSGITLQPGDIIATGTPAGVGIGFDPPRFLRSGDLVEVAITGLEPLCNQFR